MSKKYNFEWVSTKDRFPEKDGDYFVIYKFMGRNIVYNLHFSKIYEGCESEMYGKQNVFYDINYDNFSDDEYDDVLYWANIPMPEDLV